MCPPSRRVPRHQHTPGRRARRAAVLGAALLALTLVVAAAVAGSVVAGGIRPVIGPLAAAWQAAKPATDTGPPGSGGQQPGDGSQSHPGTPGAGGGAGGPGAGGGAGGPGAGGGAGTPATTPGLGEAKAFEIRVQRSATGPQDLDLTAEFVLTTPGGSAVLGTCVTDSAGSCTVSTTQQPSKDAPRGQSIEMQPGDYELAQSTAPEGLVSAGSVGTLRLCAPHDAACDAEGLVPVTDSSLFRSSGTVHVRNALTGDALPNADFTLSGPVYAQVPDAVPAAPLASQPGGVPGDLTFIGWFLPGAYTLTPVGVFDGYVTPEPPLTLTVTTADADEARTPWDFVAALQPQPLVDDGGSVGGDTTGDGDGTGDDGTGDDGTGDDGTGDDGTGGDGVGDDGTGGGDGTGGDTDGDNTGGDTDGDTGVDPEDGPNGPDGDPQEHHHGPDGTGGTGGTGSTDGTNEPGPPPPPSGGSSAGNGNPVPGSPSTAAHGVDRQPERTVENAESGTDGASDVVSAPSLERSPALVARSSTLLETGLIGFGILFVALVVIGYGWARRRSRSRR